jgi:hypothetical protein
MHLLIVKGAYIIPLGVKYIRTFDRQCSGRMSNGVVMAAVRRVAAVSYITCLLGCGSGCWVAFGRGQRGVVVSDWKKKDKGNANQLIYTHTHTHYIERSKEVRS